MRGVPVVVDINVLIDAVQSDDEDAAFESFPSPPPGSGDPNSTVLGTLNDAQEAALWLSPHILDGVYRVLTDIDEGFGWTVAHARRYCHILERIATRSGGGVVTPTTEVTDCDDWKDNRILELAAECGAFLVISNDDDLQRMSPWRGTPVMPAVDFVKRIDLVRRRATRPQASAQRRRRGPSKR